MPQPSVFISYSHQDADKASQIARVLQQHGVTTWIDRYELRAGEKWEPQIREAIDRADFILFCISRASMQSHWVRVELEHALQAQRRSLEPRFIPVLLDDASIIPPQLEHLHFVDFSLPPEVATEQLIASVHRRSVRREALGVDPAKLAENIAIEVAKRLGLEQPFSGTRQHVKDQQMVFVVCAFKPDMEPVFEGIKAAAEANGLKALRVKDVQGDYKITDKIVSMLRSARIVVVDLTYERPNVYFELGYARGLGRRVVTIARAGTPVHFDVKDWVYMEYTDSRTLEADLKKRFEYELSIDR